jgi:aryl sulfotransferase
VPPGPARYQTSLEDSARWDGLDLRPDDIVISAPSKSGTTWTQMICALLVFQTPDLPAPLTTLSPWLDMRIRPVDAVLAQLDAQRHRRFIKTHTPLDGLPSRPGVTYLAVGRDPRDVAVSLHHQSQNLDRETIQRLLGEPAPDQASSGSERRDEQDAFRAWITNEDSPFENLDTLRGVAWQQSVAWSRREDPAVMLLHYSDLSRDLEGQMRRLARRLGIPVPERSWPALVEAATFDHMRQRADDLVPNERQPIFKANARFFRSGTSGQWRAVLSADDVAEYQDRIGALASPDLVHWLHHGSLGLTALPK